MNEHLHHVEYTRTEWTTVSVFVKMINYLENKNIKNVLDIGANVGECTKIFLEKIPSIEMVYAYEPRSDNFEFLRNRFIAEPKVKPIKKGIFYGKNISPLYFNGGCGSSTVADFGTKRETEIGKHVIELVELVKLEDEGIEKLDLVKMDIEGAEYNVIQNSNLLKSARYIIVEFHSFGMDDVDEFIKYLPLGSSNHNIRVNYIKNYTDNFIKSNLPEYKMIVECECQYLLERKMDLQ